MADDIEIKRAEEAYVQRMIDSHTRLVVVEVEGHEHEWEATKHAYPPRALQKLTEARHRLRQALSCSSMEEPTSGPIPEPLLDEEGSFCAQSSRCTICQDPLLERPSLEGPFTVGFSLQVSNFHFSRSLARYKQRTERFSSNTLYSTGHSTKMTGNHMKKARQSSCTSPGNPHLRRVTAAVAFICGS